jgi:uncharacterized protein YcbX
VSGGAVAVTLARLYRFPVKGLQGTPLDSATLTAGQGLEHDRRFAVALGRTRIDPSAPRWLPKQWFVMLMRDTELARVSCRLDAEAETIELALDGRPTCRAAWRTAEGRGRLDAWLNDVAGSRRDGPAHFVTAGDTSFTDVPQNCLSLVNLASVRELARQVGRDVDPLRFRANLLIDGLPAWGEFDWIGQEVRVGEATLRIPARIPRCAATGVDPTTGVRDMNVVKALRAAYGHYDMGVYAEVVRGGRVRVADTVVPPAAPRLRSWAGHWLRFFGFLVRGAPRALRRG